MLGDDLTDTVPDWVSDYIGLPFKKYNCWQLVCLVYDKKFNRKINTYKTEYKDAKDKANIKKIYDREFNVWQKTNDPKFGDVIVLRVLGQPWHAGIIVSKKLMLHTEIGLESVIERYNGIIWHHKIIGYYRHR